MPDVPESGRSAPPGAAAIQRQRPPETAPASPERRSRRSSSLMPLGPLVSLLAHCAFCVRDRCGCSAERRFAVGSREGLLLFGGLSLRYCRIARDNVILFAGRMRYLIERLANHAERKWPDHDRAMPR